MADIFIAKPGFRNDINGLRAWAVVAVGFYHFDIPGFSGGFVGVDIFFVISGFLMTGIVVRGLEKNKFQIFEFYMARARRILPALIVLCTALLLLGWWLLLPLDYMQLAKHVIASLAFVSNIQFWNEAGYFDVASHEKWLLHTWSLAVEWQFYILLPLAMLFVWKLRPGRSFMLMAIVASMLLSFVLSVVLTPKYVTASFYLLPTRAWEMLAGGMAYLLSSRCAWTARQRKWAEAVGVVLMAGAILGFDTTSSWPGWRALFPVLGTATILLAAQPGSIWTGSVAAQWLGTRSYSLYLWHWPLVVALAYTNLRAEPGAIAAGLLLTLVLGDLSYRWVETPARVQLGKLRTAWGAAALLGTVGAVTAQGLAVHMHQGVAGRIPPDIGLVQHEALNKNPRQKQCHVEDRSSSPSCMYGGNHLRAIVLGDSHAAAIVSAVAAAAPRAEDATMQWSFSGCPTLQGVKTVREKSQLCGDSLEWAVQQLKKIPRDIPVVIANRHGAYIAGYNEKNVMKPVRFVYFSKPDTDFTSEFQQEYAKRLIETACLLAQNRQIYLMRPVPELEENVPNAARAMMWGRPSQVSISLQHYHQRNEIIWKAQDAARDRCGVKILDSLPYLCLDGQCLGIRNNRPVYYDDDHLSEYGNKFLVPLFAEIFQKDPSHPH